MEMCEHGIVNCVYCNGGDCPKCREHTNEVDRLRKALRSIAQGAVSFGEAVTMARAALAEEENG